MRVWNRFDKALIPVLLAEDIRFRGSLGPYRATGAVAYRSLSTVGPKMIPYQGIISQGCLCIQLMSAALRFRRSPTKSRLEVRQPSIRDTRLPAARP